MDLKDRVVVITGSTKGFGKALACAFIKEQSKVVINARSKEELQKVSKEIGATGYPGDVTQEKDMQELLDFSVKKFGKVDLWINNAGIWLPHKPIEDTDWKRAHDLIEVNLFGTVYGSKIALAQMRKQGSGSIVNIISTSGLDGKVNETAYCASKFAATGFTKSLAKEVNGGKIKVIGIYPGGMRTNLFDESRPKNYDEFMDPNLVAEKVIENLKLENPETEMILRRK